MLAGSTSRRLTSTTYEIAWKVKKLTPTGSAIVSSGSGIPSPTLSSVSAMLWVKNP